eukprot:CAMPEP_0170518688 /NCGR_PEP_ID=MMETSP0209-20121228/4319_1 /TAXON_ID=665100 ORGANISM="Litonotus pictus, Strain P1" /NCGR_SAMPLE_ID=MMETSP0209 /ASSEMBLY_ACC=CAM_ASM_000301 /LENGTH=302 /DNA_ID=CAMNT_0010804335 /DNA_START=410 /DNA_END=1318 /DNA_ORIENTATION=-
MKKTSQLVFYENEQEVFRETKPYTWMGLIEYDFMRKAKLNNETYKWPISIMHNTRNADDGGEGELDPAFKKDYPESLYVYFFEFEALQKLYDDEGVRVRNALHSVWLDFMSYKILQIDLKVSKYLGKNLALPTNQKEKADKESKLRGKETDALKGDSDDEELEVHQDTKKDTVYNAYNTEDHLLVRGENDHKEKAMREEETNGYDPDNQDNQYKQGEVKPENIDSLENVASKNSERKRSDSLFEKKEAEINESSQKLKDKDSKLDINLANALNDQNEPDPEDSLFSEVKIKEQGIVDDYREI